MIGAIWLITLPTVTVAATSRHYRPWGRFGVAVLVAVSAVAIAVFGNRAPVLVLLIGVGWVVLTGRGTLPRWRVVLAVATLAVIGLAFFVILRGGEAFTWTLLASRIQWLLYVNNANLEHVVSHIPAEQAFLLGRGYLIDLAVLLPGAQDNFSTWLKESIGLEFAGGGITVGLIGETYANWGPVVAVVASTLAGAGLALIRPLRPARSELDAEFMIMLALALAGVVQSGLVSILLYQVIPLIIVYFGLRNGDRLTARARAYASRLGADTRIA